MQNLNSCIDELFSQRLVENIIIKVGRGEDVICDIKRSAQDIALTDQTLFDIASVTKMVATTSLALIAMDRKMLSPSQHVSEFFPVPEDKRALTVQHLMTHTIGIGHKSMLPFGGPYEDIQNYILSIPSDIPIGTNVKYSCPAFILLGRILERIYNMKLGEAFESYVARPLGMTSTTFLPSKNYDFVNSNLSDSDMGLVNDYNCRYLGGACGNAGLFSCVADLTKYAQMLLSRGSPIISRDTFEVATRNYTPGMDEARALGFVYVDARCVQTGGLFADGSIGHCGHTGQAIFADPKSGLYVITLSDATVSTVRKYGREHYDEVMQMRRDIHAAIKADLNM